MIITPMFDRVLVRKEAFIDESAEKGLIEAPDNAKDEPETGVVVAVGPGRILPDGSLRPLAVAVGDWVLYGRYAGQDVSILKNHALIREDEILSLIQ